MGIPTLQEFKALRSDYWMQYEVMLSLLYHRFVKPGDAVIDGGANAGLHSAPLAALVGPTGIVHSFEPNPIVAENLKQRLKGKSAIVHQKALSNFPGSVSFLVNREKSALSHISYLHDKGDEGIIVEAVCLDDIISDRPISFIKLDLEGADFLALQGAERILLEDRPIVVFENSRNWHAQCFGYSDNEFFSFFEKLDYNVYDMHLRKLERDNWDDKDISYEFIAIKSDSAGEKEAIGALDKYWRRMSKLPVFVEWTECVRAVSNYNAWSDFHSIK